MRFEYDEDWLTGAGQLSGSFIDCSPDRWGKMLMERREAIEAREQKRRLRTLRSWDFSPNCERLRPPRIWLSGATMSKRRSGSNSSSRPYASAMTRLGRSNSDDASYLDIVQAIETSGSSTRIDADLEQLFRRVFINILIGNRDDHLRNHGFLREGNGWILSPAFDVNPNPGKSDHVLAINDADTSPDSSLLKATAAFYRLKPKIVNVIEQQVRGAVRDWEKRAKALGLRAAEIDLMTAVIDPDR